MPPRSSTLEDPTSIAPTPRTRLRRHPERAVPDRGVLHAILDETPIVHVATTTERGPLALPMAHGRIGDALYLHGARANGILGALAAGAEACVTATIVDGLVLARSAMHHSMNYRCAVVLGRAVDVADDGEKRRALDAVLEHALPGRAAETRAPADDELRATRVVRLSLDEASVKIRRGPPIDDADDLALPCFAGVVPLASRADLPVRENDAPLPPSLERALLARAPNVGRTREASFDLDGDPLRHDLDRVHAWLRDESYWAGDLTREVLVRSIGGALALGAYDADGAQIGFARLVTDRATFAWLADVFVDRAHRGRGVASAMVRRFRALPELSGLRKWMLGTRDAHALYARFGFTPAPDGRFMVAEPRNPNAPPRA
jgi:nitroimidazol reductase NimA-like FMN-containing flavoprotein (pyridoxamine 5'-phosphate oxidase superfamily)/GNAT superfamily N-acetyltransferase